MESYQWLSDAWNQEPNESEVEQEILSKAEQYIARRLNGEPWPYIIGFSWFMDKKFFCHQDAMIPRDNTKVVVEEALKIFNSEKNIRVADIGTGCGNIAITLALRTKWKLYGIDISGQALKVAEKNCDFHKVDVELMCGNCLSPLVRVPDMIVANMPYVDEKRKIEFESKNIKEMSRIDNFLTNEPEMSVYAPEGGNFWVKSLLKQSYEWKVPVLIQQINNNPQEMLEYAKELGWYSGWFTHHGSNPALITIRDADFNGDL